MLITTTVDLHYLKATSHHVFVPNCVLKAALLNYFVLIINQLIL